MLHHGTEKEETMASLLYKFAAWGFFFRGEGVGIDKTNCSAQPNKIKYDQRAQSDKFLFKVFIESYREEGICDLGLGG